MADSLSDCDALSNHGITAYYFQLMTTHVSRRLRHPCGLIKSELHLTKLTKIEKCEQGWVRIIRFLLFRKGKIFDEREEIKNGLHSGFLGMSTSRKNVDPVLTTATIFQTGLEILESLFTGQQIQIILISY